MNGDARRLAPELVVVKAFVIRPLIVHLLSPRGSVVRKPFGALLGRRYAGIVRECTEKLSLAFLECAC